MKNIVITEKPDEISFEEIYEVIYAAHEINRKNGIRVNEHITNGTGIEKQLGGDAVCYIALDGKKIVGTAFGTFESGKRWCVRNCKVVTLKFFAVLPEYAGNGIGSLLYEKIEQYAMDQKVDVVDLKVVEKNPVRYMYLKLGFEPVDYIYRKQTNNKTVYMVKWIKESKYPTWIRQIYYILKRTYIRIRHVGK